MIGRLFHECTLNLFHFISFQTKRLPCYYLLCMYFILMTHCIYHQVHSYSVPFRRISHPFRTYSFATTSKSTISSSYHHYRRHRHHGYNSFRIHQLSMKRPDYLDTEDVLLSGLNEKQDISVKVISCKEALQEAINRKVNISPIAARALGETMACGLLMGSGLKGEETLQVNIVGNEGMKNIMVITDGSLKVKGMVGEPEFTIPNLDPSQSTYVGCFEMMGSEGQVQVVRNHPSWKHAMNGIVSLKDNNIAMNLAFYLAESEQRTAVLIADVKVNPKTNKCEHAMALLVESLPGVEESNLEKCIQNLTKVQLRGLSSYLQNLDISELGNKSEEVSKGFIPIGPIGLRMEEVLHLILDDCFQGMGEKEGPRGDGIRFAKTPKFVCKCNIDRVFRAISLLPKKDIDEIMSEGKDIESKCGFCGKAYSVTVDQLKNHIASSVDSRKP